MITTLEVPSPLCVLVVDDVPDAVEAAAEMLGLAGFRVVTATSGEDALRISAAEHPDVVLADIRMPGMDGYELARRFRAIPGPRPLLIAVSACATAHDRAEGIVAGFDYHIAKPADPNVLTDLLHLVDRGRPRPG